MARPRKNVAIEDRIKEAEKLVEQAKSQYDEALSSLKALLDEQRELQMKKLMDALTKSDKTFEDVLRYLEL